MKHTSAYLFETLNRDLMDTNPFLTSDMSVREARTLWLKESIVSKWIPHDTSKLDQKAIDGFLECNDRCDEWREPDMTSYIDDVLHHARYLMYQYLTRWDGCVLTLTDSLQRGRNGPGASNQTKAKSYYHKSFDGDMTFTHPALYAHYRANVSETWLEADNLRHAMAKSLVVEGSKLSTVPKNERTSRTICIEPSLNMFYQLGAGSILEDVLEKHHRIDLSLQPEINRAMAKQGSIDGSYATIDLKSASDSISDKFVRWFLPESAYGVLDLLRSRYTSLNGEKIQMKMFSSMGNGFTFPLQTLIFATLVRALYEMKGLTPQYISQHRCYSVFGDDIIVRGEFYHTMCEVLRRCGFTVNDEKSYGVGPFRESCGSDFFRGENIRGVYIKELNHETHVYSSFNRLARWSARSGISITSILLHLKGLVDFRPIPFDESDDAGIKTPSVYLTNRRTDPNGSIYYRALKAVPRTMRLRSAKNPPGVMLCAIGGYLRNECISLRGDNNAFKVVKNVTPFWDYIPHAGLTIREYLHIHAMLAVCES